VITLRQVTVRIILLVMVFGQALFLSPVREGSVVRAAEIPTPWTTTNRGPSTTHGRLPILSPRRATKPSSVHAQTVPQPIAPGDLILSLYSPNEVNEYTSSGAFVQTLMDSSDGLCEPAGSAFDAAGNLYITDFQCNQILKLDTSGHVSVFSNDSHLSSPHVFNAPESIAFNPSGTLMYVSNANRGGAGGGINILDAATGNGIGVLPLPSSDGSDGVGESDWLAFNAEGSLFMTNENPTQGVMQIDSSAGDIISPSFAANLPNTAYALSFDKNGNVWVADTDRLIEYDPSGALLQTITNPNFSTAFAAVFDPAGTTFYVGDQNNGNVYIYDLNGNLISSFGTPASGINGVSVTGNPLVVGSVSPTLSTVSVSSDSAPADGTTAVQVTVTLRDINGNPVAGKTVNISSSRGTDTLIQPDGPSDATGRVTARVVSNQPGTSQISALDVSDGVSLQQQATITIGASGALADEIRALQTETHQDLTGSDSLTIVAQHLADDGDALLTDIPRDTAQLAYTVLKGGADVVGAALPDPNPDSSLELGVPGLEAQGETHISEFDNLFDPQHTTFDDSFTAAVQDSGSADGPGLTQDVMLDGARSEAAKLEGESLQDVTEDKAFETISDAILPAQSGLTNTWFPHIQQEASLLQQDVDWTTQRTLASLPPMDSQRQDAWQHNLIGRAKADLEQEYYQEILANTVDTLKIDHDTESANPLAEALLRNGGKALSEGLAPIGPIAYSSALLAFDTALATAKLQEAGSTAGLAIGGLNSVPNTIVNIDQNVVNGLDALRQGKLPDTSSGSVTEREDLSSQTCHLWHLICTEDASSSRLAVTNTGAITATFVVNAQYTTSGGTLGIYPLGEVATASATIAPGQTSSIVVSYKNGNHGSSQQQGSTVTFDLLATNDTGTFLVDHEYTTWQPHVAYPHAISSIASLSSSDAIPSTPAPDLVSSYALADPATNSYKEEVWVNNPLSQTVTAMITQTVPGGLSVGQIGDGGIQQGNNVVWTTTVPAQTSQPVTMTVQLADATAGQQILPAASADLVDSAGNDSGPLATEPITVTPLQLLQVDSGIPGQIAPGASVTVPYTVTNVSPNAVDGTLAMTLTTSAGLTVFTSQQPVNVGANSSAVISIPLPATLPVGLLQESVSVTGAGIAPVAMTNLVMIR